MREISKRRFDILAGYARGPLAAVMGQELAWFATEDESVLACLWVDTDGEFVAVVLAPDLRKRYRSIHVTNFHEHWSGALEELQTYLSSDGAPPGQPHSQGDEVGPPVDFFAAAAPEAKVSPTFRMLRSGNAFSAARDVLSALMRWHEDVDGNFVEQFQTSGFDARLWEMYLLATLSEAGFFIERPRPAPDFVAHGLTGAFALEATTINQRVVDGIPVASVRPPSGKQDRNYHDNYLPTRYAGPLTAKLKKRYWESPATSGLPMVFAIQDFHDLMSMSYSGSALPIYLYGWRHEASRDTDGRLVVHAHRVTEHVWGSKVVPSGFFDLPEAENVSAVLFNSLGTLSKFNRMGVQAGFGSPNVTLVHHGFAVDPDPNADTPLPFAHEVTLDTHELWIDGLDVFHNPNASRPLDAGVLPRATHHRLLPDGLVESTGPVGKVISSATSTITRKAPAEPAEG